MRAPNLIFSSPGNLENAWARWVDPLRAAWPGLERPRVNWSPIDEFARGLEGREPHEGENLPAGALVVLNAAESGWTIDRLVEGLLSRQVPGIILLPDPLPWKQFQRHGVLFESHEADPRTLAAMLFALTERQSAIDLLQRELYVAQRAQSGFRAEMDRLHDELHMAASVQREFIPTTLPSLAELDLGVIFRPSNYVSGDIYDVERLDDRTVGFFIADAVGHGVPAALLTMVLSHNLTLTEAADAGRARRIVEPARVLGTLNERLCQARSINGRFATALYATVDLPTRLVTIAGAGHPAPIVVGRDENRAVETEGPLLGVFPDAVFPQVSFTLEEGHTLLLYTDGLEAAFLQRYDAPDPARRAMYRHLDALREVVARDPEHDAAAAMNDLGAILDEQAGSLHQLDDVTVLAIRPSPVQGVLPRLAPVRATAA